MTWYELGPHAAAKMQEALAAWPGQDPLTWALREAFTPPQPLVEIEGYPEGAPPEAGLSEEEEAELARLQISFEEAGGRGVATAEAIDKLVAKRDGVFDPDEYPIRKGLQCPYCQTVHWDGEEEGIRVVDVASRWHSFGFDAERERITGSYDNDGDYETNTYVCESCEHDVALPAGITEEGW